MIIYKITNSINGKMYIGQTKTLEQANILEVFFIGQQSLTHQQIAERFGVKRCVIADISAGRTYGFVS